MALKSQLLDNKTDDQTISEKLLTITVGQAK